MSTFHNFKLLALSLAALLVVTGCSSEPTKEELAAMQAATEAVAQAKSADAAASTAGYDSNASGALLAQAEEAMAANDLAQATTLAEKAQQAAKAASAIGRADAAIAAVTSAGADAGAASQLLADARSAYAVAGYGKATTTANRAIDSANQSLVAFKEAQARQVVDNNAQAQETADTITTYVVTRGDHLWGIAGMGEHYADSFMWPLIYKQNRDQIRDADLIFAGQELSINLSVSDGDRNAAVEHARNRGAWSIGQTEASDESYLNQ